jgi:hypothetical protein
LVEQLSGYHALHAVLAVTSMLFRRGQFAALSRLQSLDGVSVLRDAETTNPEETGHTF